MMKYNQMVKKISLKSVLIYYTLVLASCSLSMSVYGQLFLVLLTTPVFFILSIQLQNRFNEDIRIKYPELYKKHVYVARQLEVLDIGNLVSDEEYKQIKNIEIKNQLKLCNQLTSLAFISFLILILHAVIFMMFI